MFQVLIVTVFILILLIYWKWIRPLKFIYDQLREQGIPHEPFVPVLGQLPEIRRYREEGRLLEYHQNLTGKHGLIYLFSLGPYPRLTIQEPEFLVDILSRNSADYFSKPNDLGFRLKPIIGLHNLLVSNGREHSRARAMLNPAFHYGNLQSMVSIMTDQTFSAIDSILQSSSNGEFIDLSTHFNALTLAIIASSAFGQSFQTMHNARDLVQRTFTEVLAALSYRAARLINIIPIISMLPWWKKKIVDQGCREMSEFVRQIINDRRLGRSESLCAGDDLLDLLLSAVDDQGHRFTDEEIHDQALTFVLAGHETTTQLMLWTMYVLMSNPNIADDCLDEIDRILPDRTIPTATHLNQLVIIEAVLQETLRLYPPVPFFIRQCLEEHTIGEQTDHPIRLPRGTTVLIHSYAIHRRAEYWPRPLEFDYKRWLRDPQTGLKPKLSHPYCYLPFAAGPRNCIGQNFALLEAKVMLALLLQRCRFELKPEQKIIPEIRITMRPKDGLYARVTSRVAAKCSSMPRAV